MFGFNIIPLICISSCLVAQISTGSFKRQENGDYVFTTSNDDKLASAYRRWGFNQNPHSEEDNPADKDLVNVKGPFASHLPPVDSIQQQIKQLRAHYQQQKQQLKLNPFSQSQPQQLTQQQRPPPPPAASSTSKGKITASEIKKLLEELLERLNAVDLQELTTPEPIPIPTNKCTLHGLWYSAVTGVGIHLEPTGDDDLTLTVIDMGVSNTNLGTTGQDSDQPIISSEWTGKAVVSTESATTISIVLQEKWMIGRGKEPNTAVFVGQCVICSESATIQGTWIVFPESQTCFEDISEKVEPKSDVMYLLK